jgi:hypothetical protein
MENGECLPIGIGTKNQKPGAETRKQKEYA